MRESQNIPSDDMRQRILEQATCLFGAQGFAGTSLQAISDAVGIRKPSLLYHFGSKEELREAVLENLLAHWKNELPRLLSSGTDEHDRFSSVITAVIGYFLQNTNRARLILRETIDRPSTMQALAEEHLSPWIKLIVDYIRMGQKSRVVKPEVDPESYIIQIIMMVVGTVALGEVASAMFHEEGHGSREAVTCELIRIAREALLVNPKAR